MFLFVSFFFFFLFSFFQILSFSVFSIFSLAMQTRYRTNSSETMMNSVVPNKTSSWIEQQISMITRLLFALVMPNSLNLVDPAVETSDWVEARSLHSTATMSSSKRRTISDSDSGSERVGESGKRREMTNSGSAESWETKSQESPLDFLLGWVWCMG